MIRCVQEFILTQLLMPIGKRRYASQANQCDLAAACIRHLTLSIRCYAASAGEPTSHIFHDPAAAHTGATALSHLLSPSSPLLRELITHVLHASPTLETAAVERLTALRADDPCGRAAEAAVAALFELLLVVFDLDGKWVQLQRRMHALVETLDAALLGRPAVALQLMQFVRYGYSSWMQAAAVRVAGTLAARDESVTTTLLQFGDEAAALVHSFAGCLSSRAVVPEDPEVEDEWEEVADRGGPGDAIGGGDDAAGDGGERMEIRGLVLQLMLDCADMPFPNFTQLLLGYHVSGVRLVPCAAACNLRNELVASRCCALVDARAARNDASVAGATGCVTYRSLRLRDSNSASLCDHHCRPECVAWCVTCGWGSPLAAKPCFVALASAAVGGQERLPCRRRTT